MVVETDGFLEIRLPLGKIVVGQQARVRRAAGVFDRVGRDEVNDALGDLALVEGVARGLDAGHAPAPGSRLLGAAKDAQSLGPGGIAKQIADLGRLSRRQVDLAGAGVKLGVLGFVAGQAVAEARVDGKAVLSELDGGLHDLGEAQGSKAGQGRGPRSDHGGHAGRQIAVAGN